MSHEDAPQLERLREALTLAIKDQESKYDECLVERLLLCFTVGDEQLLTIASQVITDLNNDITFQEMNHSRLFRLQQAYCDNKKSRMDANLEGGWLCSIWSKMPSILSKNDPSEIKSLLPLLAAIVERGRRSSWLLNMHFKEPIQFDQITDILSIIKYFLLKKKNYHIENAACNLLIALIKQSSTTETEQSVNTAPIRLARELIFAGCPAIYYVIQNLTVSDEDSNPKLKMFQDSLEARLEVAIKNHELTEINSICKCLSRIMNLDGEAKHADSLMIKLQETGCFEPMLTLATHLIDIETGDRPLFHLILYAILTRCDRGPLEESLISQLELNSTQREFVEKSSKDKDLLQCLKYLDKSFSRPVGDSSPKTNYGAREECLTFKVILQYIRSNYHRADKLFKNLINSCKLLTSFLNRLSSESRKYRDDSDWFEWLPEQMNIIFSELIEPFHENTSSSSRKGLMLELTSGLENFFDWICVAQIGTQDQLRMRIIKFAWRCRDPDLLCQLSEVLQSASPCIDRDSLEYIDLTWNHMRGVAADENHRILLDKTIYALSRIDVECHRKDLRRAGLTRFDTIPNLISSILKDPTMDDEIIENIATMLSYGVIYYNSPDHHWPQDRYVGFICQYADDSCIGSLIDGICKALKPDLAQEHQIQLIDSLETILISSHRNEITGPRWREGILRTLYRLHTDSDYGQEVCERACEVVRLVNDYKVNLDVNQAENASFAKFLSEHQTASECPVPRKPSRLHQHNRLGLESYVDQIMNQKGAVTLECY